MPGVFAIVDEDAEIREGVVECGYVGEVYHCFVSFVGGWVVLGVWVVGDVWHDDQVRDFEVVCPLVVPGPCGCYHDIDAWCEGGNGLEGTRSMVKCP